LAKRLGSVPNETPSRVAEAQPVVRTSVRRVTVAKTPASECSPGGRAAGGDGNIVGRPPRSSESCGASYAGSGVDA
jgi:hypothetical protein